MSRTAHKLMASSGSKGYEIDQSLMFDDGDTSYLTRSPGSAGNLKTWTLSFWIKRANLGALQIMYSSDNGSSGTTDYGIIYFDSSDRLGIYYGNITLALTNRVFRDVSSWYHIYIKMDTTQGTASDRWDLKINGVSETSFSESYNPNQNTDLPFNNNHAHYLGRISGGYYYPGYIAEFHSIDGTAKAVGDFAETDSETGQWIPKQYTGGSYGTTGFYLKFVSGAIGTDSSGSSNTWTANNLANADVMLDTPTNNHCTVNSLDNSGNLTTSQGNTKFHASDTNRVCFKGTMGVSSGKWYYEYTDAATSSGSVGVVNASATSLVSNGMVGNSSFGWAVNNDGAKENGNSETASYMASFTTNDVIGVALNMDDGEITFYKNGSSAGVAFNNLSGKGAIFPAVCTGSHSGAFDTLNFGQMSFAHTPPTGYKAWNTSNLPAPTIKKSSEHFVTTLWSGNDASSPYGNQTVDTGMQVDMTWHKTRSHGVDHRIHDRIRTLNGNTDTGHIFPNLNNAEDNAAVNFDAWTSTGFTVKGNSNRADGGARTYVSWNWKANGTGSSDSSKDITATVSANTTSGFSIVTYTAPSSDGTQTVPHGLGVTPKVAIYKARSTTGNWTMLHTLIDGSMDYMKLNDTDLNGDATYSFSSSTIPCFEASSQTMVAYCFAEVEGFSQFSMYEGNGDAEDGPYINTGFKPQFVIVKKASANGSSWFMWDSVRHPRNVIDLAVWADAANADTSHAQYEIDFLSNGFKLRGNNAGSNVSGQLFIYMAFAEAPFKYATAR